MNSTIVRSLNDSEKGFIVTLRTLGCCITIMYISKPLFPSLVFIYILTTVIILFEAGTEQLCLVSVFKLALSVLTAALY